MRWVKIFALSCLLFLSCCGFSPIYGTSGDQKTTVSESMNAVIISNIPNRTGQKLKNHLVDRMHTSQHVSENGLKARTWLNVELNKNEVDLGFQKDATTTRKELNLWANYHLVDDTGRVLCKGKAHSVVSYSKLAAQYGTVAAQENAEDRSIREVGEQIVNRISLFYAEKIQMNAKSEHTQTDELTSGFLSDIPVPMNTNKEQQQGSIQ